MFACADDLTVLADGRITGTFDKTDRVADVVAAASPAKDTAA